MKKLIYAIGGILVLLIVAVVAAPFFVSTEAITQRIVAEVKERTGRELRIGSDAKLAIFPSIAIEATDVALSNPGGLEAGALVTMGEIKVDLALMPLISGDINVERFVLVKPVIALVVDSEGRANWDFTSGEAPAGGTTGGDGTSSGGVGNVRLGQIEVVEGELSYADARTGAAHKASNINFALALPDLTSPLKATGAADWNGETVKLDIDLGSPQDLMDGKATQLAATVDAPHVGTAFKGSVSAINGNLVITGDVEAKTPSLRELARWAGNPLAPGNGLEAFSMTSKVNYADSTITASDAKISLDGMNAQGSAVVALGGKRPSVRGSLGVDKIDVNSYLGGGGSGASGDGGSGGSGGGWSEAALDFSGLAAVDADLKLAANAIAYKQIQIGKSALEVAIASGKLTAKLTQLALYGGSGSGTLTLDGGAKTPALAANLAIGGIDARPLLTDAMGMKWLEGTGELGVNVAAQGASQRQMVGSLGGNAKLLFTNGAIRGINIPQMMRSLGSNPLTGWSGGEAQKTDFSSFSASFQIAKGVASNSDLQMVGPLVRMTGAGTISMPSQSIDYKVRPKLVASLEGQGGALDLSGLDIPVIIKGPWSNPQIYPDIEGVLQNPEAAYKAIKNVGKGLGKALKNGKPEDVLNNLLGNQSGGEADGGAAAEGEKKKDPIGKALKKLF
jgi:AsmA protein